MTLIRFFCVVAIITGNNDLTVAARCPHQIHVMTRQQSDVVLKMTQHSTSRPTWWSPAMIRVSTKLLDDAAHYREQVNSIKNLISSLRQKKVPVASRWTSVHVEAPEWDWLCNTVIPANVEQGAAIVAQSEALFRHSYSRMYPIMEEEEDQDQDEPVDSHPSTNTDSSVIDERFFRIRD